MSQLLSKSQQSGAGSHAHHMDNVTSVRYSLPAHEDQLNDDLVTSQKSDSNKECEQADHTICS